MIRADQLFFCTGSPKSGTTFLQMILDRHPVVSCPSEHRLSFFVERLPTLLTEYNHELRRFDGMTGRQGHAPLRNEDVNHLFREIVKLAALRGARGRRVSRYGLNDNPLLDLLRFYLDTFPESRFIVIVRDPRAVMVSSWHHNVRNDPEFTSRHANLEVWADYSANFWTKRHATLLKLVASPAFRPRILICRYEALNAGEIEAFTALFEFLGVDSSPTTVAAVIEATRFEKFQDGKFFRRGGNESWREELPDSARATVEQENGELMREFGYL